MPIIDETWFVKPAGIAERQTAGGVVARVDNGEILIAFAHEAKYESYVLPKGGIDSCESALEAAEREIEEEAGITELKLLGKLGVCERLSFNKKRWAVVQYFLFLTSQRGGQPTDTDKHPQPAVWYGLNKLPKLFWPEQDKLLMDNRDKIQQLVMKAAK